MTGLKRKHTTWDATSNILKFNVFPPFALDWIRDDVFLKGEKSFNALFYLFDFQFSE